MPSIPTRVAFFLSSYAPLWVILGFKSLPEWMPWYYGTPFYLLALGSVVWLYYYLTDLEGKPSKEIKVTSVTPKDKEVANYLLFYIFPFLGLDLGKWEDSLALLLLFGTLVVLYVRARMTYVNPILGLLGYHFYEVELQDGEEQKVCGLVTKSPYVRADQWLDGVYAKEDYVYIQKPDRTANGDNSSRGSSRPNGNRRTTRSSKETQRVP